MHTARMNIAWIKNRLHEVGKTHEDLAQAIGRNRSIITRLLNGTGRKNFPIHYLMPFAETLEINIEEMATIAGIELDSANGVDAEYIKKYAKLPESRKLIINAAIDSFLKD